MCGILGSIGKFNKQNFIKALNSIEHRGPDHTGICSVSNKKITNHSKNSLLSTNDSIAFAHQRLSIIDLSSNANQPFIKFDKILIFNGEIYNYLELKNELIKKGYSFYTSSDTEVLLTSYQEWGSKCLNKFNGMWAFAIYDIAKNEIFLSRDRFGIKPLYYSFENSSFSFASELKALQKINKCSIDYNQVLHYLFYGEQESSKDSFLKGIFKLLPSTYMKYNLNTNEYEIIKYYSLKFREKSSVKELQELFSNSVNLRLRADVKIAIALSGGMDSSSILYESMKNKNLYNETFSIVFDKYKNIDESYWIDIMSKFSNIKNNKLSIKDNDIINDISSFIKMHDEPTGGTSFFAEYKLFEFIKKHNIKVALTGQGGDEIFGGYLYTSIIANPIGIFFNNNANTNRVFLLKSLVYMLFPKLYEKLITKKINKELNYKGKLPENSNNTFRHKFDINDLLLNEVNTGLRILLKHTDRNSMANSIEARLPYLDYRFVEAVFSFSSDEKIKDNWSRYLQRLMFDKRLPDEIVWRKKKLGFANPGSVWIELLRKNQKFIDIVVNSNILRNLEINLNVKDNNLFWKLLNIAIWEKEFFN